MQCLTDYDPSRLEDMLHQMHEIEHHADEKKHEMSVALAKAFMTPFDREDLAELSQKIDDVTDTIEEVMQRFYIDSIQVPAPDALEFAQKISGCCVLMKKMLGELENYKKRSSDLHQMIIDLGHEEENCDRFYLHVTKRAKDDYTDPLSILLWREVFDYMENCADACEHVGDSVETIVIKNT